MSEIEEETGEEVRTESKTKKRVKRNKLLFDVYYRMGADRDLMLLADHSGVPLDDLLDIYTREGWATKIQDLEEIEERKFEEQLKNKSKKIRQMLTEQITGLLETLDQSSMGLPLAINTVQDLKTVSGAYAELVRATDTVLKSPKTVDVSDQPITWSDLLEAAGEEIHHE